MIATSALTTEMALQATAQRDKFRWETNCPVSGTDRWLLDEDLKHIERMTRGTLEHEAGSAIDLNEWVSGHSRLDATHEFTTESASDERTDCWADETEQTHAKPALRDASSGQDATFEEAPEIHSIPWTDQVRDAARPTFLMWAASSAASVLGGLALVNGAALVIWSYFGAHPEMMTVGLPGSLAGLGLLIVGHMLHGSAEKHAAR